VPGVVEAVQRFVPDLYRHLPSYPAQTQTSDCTTMVESGERAQGSAETHAENQENDRRESERLSKETGLLVSFLCILESQLSHNRSRNGKATFSGYTESVREGAGIAKSGYPSGLAACLKFTRIINC
jgi:hypothetical protein